jgi:hypothetical protein
MAHNSKRPQKSQQERFIKAAREDECSENEPEFDRKLKRIARATPKSSEKKSPRMQSDGD